MRERRSGESFSRLRVRAGRGAAGAALVVAPGVGFAGVLAAAAAFDFAAVFGAALAGALAVAAVFGFAGALAAVAVFDLAAAFADALAVAAVRGFAGASAADGVFGFAAVALAFGAAFAFGAALVSVVFGVRAMAPSSRPCRAAPTALPGWRSRRRRAPLPEPSTKARGAQRIPSAARPARAGAAQGHGPRAP